MTRRSGTKVSYYTDGNLEVDLKKYFQTVQDKFVDRTDNLLIKFNELLLARTPVWSGDAIHNWRWSTRSPNMQHEDPIEAPEDPGHTNRMRLGEEPRRAANATRPRMSLSAALRAREPVDIYLTNTSEHAVDLEAGLLPNPPGSGTMPSRATPGFLRLTLKEVFGGYV